MTIDVADASAMVRLLGETAAHSGTCSEKKRILMYGLCQLVEADCWVWSLGHCSDPSQGPRYAGVMHGGFDDHAFAKFIHVLEHPDNAKLCAKWIEDIQQRKAQSTFLLEELDPHQSYAESGIWGLMAEANICDVLVSGVPVDDSSLSAIGLYRSFESGPFTKRQKLLAHIILSEVPWLHQAGWAHKTCAEAPRLYPRQRMVLNLLLDGHGRKHISQHMNLTENTVSGYIKDVYRHFSVNSHAQLLSKFLVGAEIDI